MASLTGTTFHLAALINECFSYGGSDNGCLAALIDTKLDIQPRSSTSRIRDEKSTGEVYAHYKIDAAVMPWPIEAGVESQRYNLPAVGVGLVGPRVVVMIIDVIFSNNG